MQLEIFHLRPHMSIKQSAYIHTWKVFRQQSNKQSLLRQRQCLILDLKYSQVFLFLNHVRFGELTSSSESQQTIATQALKKGPESHRIFFYIGTDFCPNGRPLSTNRVIHRFKELIRVINNNSKLIIIPIGLDNGFFSKWILMY